MRFALRRALQAAIVIAVVASLAFVLIHFAPGDPFPSALDDPHLTDALRARLRTQYGFDEPIVVQYLRFLASYARGELGWSVGHGRPVASVLATVLPRTVLLMAVGLGLGLVGGVALGTWQAMHRGSRVERLTGFAALVVLSVPEFLVALLAIRLFAQGLQWFPMSGLVDMRMHGSMDAWERAGDVARHLALPALTLAALVAAAVSRYHRAAMLAVLPEDFVRTARAKGLTERRVILRHVLPNAIGTALSIAGLLIPAVFGGATIIEKFFAWPGMGLAMFDAAVGRDYQLVVAGVVLSGVFVAIGSAFADVIAARLDPRQARR
ncbi:MAG: ABC transporter permease [Gemmatimonadetes bacterium]|nr:ABC transporter permease [Gemmatimonadota bacterium]MBI3567882.1 ABC transporter permease [Gemmatimonadota bacterium]